jgi:uncharacterized protein DUF4388
MGGLTGELQVMDLADILGWLAHRGRTGTLHVTARSTRNRLVVNEGLLDATYSNDPRYMLGQFLVRDAAITEQQLFESLLLQERDKRLLGAILMSQQLLTPEQLARSLRACAEETVYDMFLWTEGRFELKPGEAGPPHLVPLRLELLPLIQEGLWRQNEWQRMCKELPSLEVNFRALPGAALPSDAAEKRLVELASAGHSLARISLETRRSPFETAAHLLALCDQGLLAVDQRVEDDAAATDAVGAIEKSLKAAADRLGEGRFDAAMSAYEYVLALDSLNQEAKKGILAVAEGRRRQRMGRRVPLERIPVVSVGSMALTQQLFDPQEGFLLSRINGEWDVRSILKLCPLPEDHALEIFARLLDRRVIELV